VCVEIPAQVIVHILLELRHLLLSNRRSGDQTDTLLLLRFLLEMTVITRVMIVKLL